MSQQNAVKVQTVIPIVALIAACAMGGKIITEVAYIKESLHDIVIEQRSYNLNMERRMGDVERRVDRINLLGGFDKVDGTKGGSK